MFDQVDIAALVGPQTKFLAAAPGGPEEYGEDYLREAHCWLAISDAQFDEMGRLLADALQQHNTESSDIEAVLAFVESTCPSLLT